MRLKEKENKSKKKRIISKSWLIIAGFFLFVLGTGLLSFEYIEPIVEEHSEKKAIEEFFKEEEKNEEIKEEPKTVEVKQEEKQEEKQITKPKYQYIAVLKIPKIKLEKGLVEKTSKYNSINYGVEILKESDSPDVINGNVILSAHSGTASISYFRNLDKLSVGDEAIIYYKGNTYKYKFVNIYDIEKTGKAKIKKENNTSTLTLITCRHNTNKQIILIAELQKEEL